jgi:hypothetical protein
VQRAAFRQLRWFDIQRGEPTRIDILTPAPPTVFSPSGEPLLGTYAGAFGTIDLTPRLSPLQYPQLKKWFFGTLSSSGLLAGFAVVDAGYGSTAFVSVVDLDKGAMLVDRGEIGLPLVSTVINSNPGAGARATFADGIGGSLSVSITRGAESTPFRVEIVSKDDGLRIDATLDPTGAPLPVSSLAPTPPGDINATVKWSLLPVTGFLQLGAREWNLAEGFRGGFDCTQGILPSHTVWNWASLQGTADDGTAVGLNLTGGIFPDGQTGDNALRPGSPWTRRFLCRRGWSSFVDGSTLVVLRFCHSVVSSHPSFGKGVVLHGAYADFSPRCRVGVGRCGCLPGRPCPADRDRHPGPGSRHRGGRQGTVDAVVESNPREGRHDSRKDLGP